MILGGSLTMMVPLGSLISLLNCNYIISSISIIFSFCVGKNEELNKLQDFLGFNAIFC